MAEMLWQRIHEIFILFIIYHGLGHVEFVDIVYTSPNQLYIYCITLQHLSCSSPEVSARTILPVPVSPPSCSISVDPESPSFKLQTPSPVKSVSFAYPSSKRLHISNSNSSSPTYSEQQSPSGFSTPPLSQNSLPSPYNLIPPSGSEQKSPSPSGFSTPPLSQNSLPSPYNLSPPSGSEQKSPSPTGFSTPPLSQQSSPYALSPSFFDRMSNSPSDHMPTPTGSSVKVLSEPLYPGASIITQKG